MDSCMVMNLFIQFINIMLSSAPEVVFSLVGWLKQQLSLTGIHVIHIFQLMKAKGFR